MRGAYRTPRRRRCARRRSPSCVRRRARTSRRALKTRRTLLRIHRVPATPRTPLLSSFRMPAPPIRSDEIRIELRALTRRLPSGDRLLTILDRIDLSIAAGEFVAVLGPSGSGKSTLLALMAGLDRPTSGEVRLAGSAIQDLSEDALALLRRDKIGFVFQSFQLLGNRTARENVLLPLELAGRPEAGARADALLSTVGLAERGHHYPSQL